MEDRLFNILFGISAKASRILSYIRGVSVVVKGTGAEDGRCSRLAKGTDLSSLLGPVGGRKDIMESVYQYIRVGRSGAE